MSHESHLKGIWRMAAGLKSIACCLVAALAAPVLAAPTVTVSADYSLGGGAVVMEASQSAPSGTYPSNVDILRFTGSGVNSIGIHTYGDVAGSNLGNRVSGTNTFTSNGLMRYTTSASGMFNFSIIPGEVSAFGSSSFSSGEGQHAGIRFLITGGASSTVLFDASAEARVGFGLSTIATCDAPLGCTTTVEAGGNGVEIFLAGGAQSLDLDMLLGVGPHDLVYDISAFSRGVVLTANEGACVSPPFTGGGEQGGNDGPAIAAFVNEGGGSSSAACSAIARSGDPLPLPGTVYLIGLGLVGLGLSRKRKQA